MARPARPWFRFYVEALHDPKLRDVAPAHRWVWVAVMGAARQSPEPGWLLKSATQPMSDRALADLAAVSLRDVRKALAEFEAAHMIERDPDRHGGAWHVINFGKRQYESDVSTERTRRHRSKNSDGTFQPRSRERSKNSDATPMGTPPETEAENRTPLTPPSDSPQGAPGQEEGQGSIVDQAVHLAAQRYGQQEHTAGRGRSADGLARWWLQENADGARLRAERLFDVHDLTAAQLADVLGAASDPPWLTSYRRRPALDGAVQAEPTAVAAITAATRDRLRHPHRAEAS